MRETPNFLISRASLTSAFWSPRQLRVSPVDPLKHIGHLRRRDRHSPARRRWPDELPPVQSFGVKREPDPVVPEDLGHIAATASEDIEIASMGIAFESFLNLKRQTLHPASHVGVPRRNPDPDAGRDGNHDCAITWRTRISAAVSTSAHTMTRSPLASTISICPVDP